MAVSGPPPFPPPLAQTGQWDNTMIVLTADHGEQLGDHWQLGKLGYFRQSYAGLTIGPKFMGPASPG